jgi:adenylate cyclase
VKPPSNDIVIIALDEPSYFNLNVPMGDTWPRAYHAKLLQRLAQDGVKRVVFDMLFVAPSVDSVADNAFAEALRFSPTVLGAAIDLTQQSTANGSFTLEQMTRPISLFERHAASIGVVGLPHTFGRIRSFYANRSPLFPDVPSLAEAAAHVGSDEVRARPKGRDLINYYGPASTIPRFSYHDVISDENRIPSETFKDKIVFVGLNLRSRAGPSQREAFENPFDTNVYGTEVHATATSNLMRKEWISRVSSSVELVACGVIVACTVMLLVSLQGVSAVVITSTWAGVVLASQFGLFLSKIYIGLATPLLMGLCAGAIARIVLAQGHRRLSRRWT